MAVDHVLTPKLTKYSTGGCEITIQAGHKGEEGIFSSWASTISIKGKRVHRRTSIEQINRTPVRDHVNWSGDYWVTSKADGSAIDGNGSNRHRIPFDYVKHPAQHPGSRDVPKGVNKMILDLLVVMAEKLGLCLGKVVAFSDGLV